MLVYNVCVRRFVCSTLIGWDIGWGGSGPPSCPTHNGMEYGVWQDSVQLGVGVYKTSLK